MSIKCQTCGTLCDAVDGLDDCPCLAVVAQRDEALAAAAGWMANYLTVLGQREVLRAALKTYGDHRWKCAVSRYLRENKVTPLIPVCDCGWIETTKLISLTETSR